MSRSFTWQDSKAQEPHKQVLDQRVVPAHHHRPVAVPLCLVWDIPTLTITLCLRSRNRFRIPSHRYSQGSDATAMTPQLTPHCDTERTARDPSQLLDRWEEEHCLQFTMSRVHRPTRYVTLCHRFPRPRHCGGEEGFLLSYQHLHSVLFGFSFCAAFSKPAVPGMSSRPHLTPLTPTL